MRNLDSRDFCVREMKKCKQCHGEGCLNVNGVWCQCICQVYASYKYNFYRLRINPESLKQKTWDDFTGVITKEDITVGMLEPKSVREAKDIVLQYCYRDGDNSNFNNLILHEHLKTGRNIIIGGSKASGKTLLGCLIIKEVIYDAIEFRSKIGRTISFDWVYSSELKHAARWDNSKSIDHAYLEQLVEMDFLVIDDVDFWTKEGHHTNPPDRISLDMFFGERDIHSRPTIMLCSDTLLDMVSPRYMDSISQQWGGEFFNLLSKPSNMIVRLKKGRAKI
jgi:hypothetical protein